MKTESDVLVSAYFMLDYTRDADGGEYVTARERCTASALNPYARELLAIITAPFRGMTKLDYFLYPFDRWEDLHDLYIDLGNLLELSEWKISLYLAILERTEWTNPYIDNAYIQTDFLAALYEGLKYEVFYVDENSGTNDEKQRSVWVEEIPPQVEKILVERYNNAQNDDSEYKTLAEILEPADTYSNAYYCEFDGAVVIWRLEGLSKNTVLSDFEE